MIWISRKVTLDAEAADREAVAADELGGYVATAIAMPILLVLGSPFALWFALRTRGIDLVSRAGVVAGALVPAAWAASNGYWWQLAIGSALTTFLASLVIRASRSEVSQRKGAPKYHLS